MKETGWQPVQWDPGNPDLVEYDTECQGWYVSVYQRGDGTWGWVAEAGLVLERGDAGSREAAVAATLAAVERRGRVQLTLPPLPDVPAVIQDSRSGMNPLP